MRSTLDKFEISAKLAASHFDSGNWEQCLEHVQASGHLRSGLAKLEAISCYQLAKRYSSYEHLSKTSDYLRSVLRLGGEVPPSLRRFTQRRLQIGRASEEIITQEQCPVCRDDKTIIPAQFIDATAYQPEVDSVYCIAAYRSGYDPQRADTLSKTIRSAKSSRGLCSGLGILLGHCIVAHADPAFWKSPDIIVPVPTSPDRYAQRGFSIAEELSVGIEKATGIPLFSSAVRIVRPTRDLRSLGRAERRDELAGVFEVTDQELIEGASILLIDDVTTHGTTLFEMARTIRESGGASIYAAVVAHTVSSWWE